MSPGCTRGGAVAAAEHVVGAEPRAHDVAAVHDVGVAPLPRPGVSLGRFGRSLGLKKPGKFFLTLFKICETKNELQESISILYVFGA